jgi:hypothetical protein
MFADMSAVTALCSSTAAAVEAMNSLTPAIAALIAVSELATSPEIVFSASISEVIVSVAWLARFFTSEATTAKHSGVHTRARASVIVRATFAIFFECG